MFERHRLEKTEGKEYNEASVSRLRSVELGPQR
jgi:hypothetical protein